MTESPDELRRAALEYHRFPQPGKTETVPSKPFATPRDLALAYSPGVAFPSLEIAADARRVYEYTDKANSVAVISNGTAVLGLGDIGALAAKPVMEGKALLFKIFGGIDAVDIEVDEKDPQRFIDTVRAIAGSFGGINLEDIKAPECFQIEEALVHSCHVPVMHDDQHGTAVITAAAMINAADIQGKSLDSLRLVVNGAGAAAIACTRLLVSLGIRRENIIMCDSHGPITAARTDLNEQKKQFVTDRTDIRTLADAMRGADAFLGLSVADVLTPEMLASMAPRPIVFALANPDPEIARDIALDTRSDIVFATGRSDYPNQINNVLGFPYIFRGALDCRATCINEAMKLAAAHAIARLARLPAPDEVRRIYPGEQLAYGPDYILPKPYDRRLLSHVAPEVVRAATDAGVALHYIADLDAYTHTLDARIRCLDSLLTTYIDHTCPLPFL